MRKTLLTRCEESASILIDSMASGLSGQWKTRNPAKTSSDSTSSRVRRLIWDRHGDQALARTRRKCAPSLTLAIGMSAMVLVPRARTRDPRRVKYLYISS